MANLIVFVYLCGLRPECSSEMNAWRNNIMLLQKSGFGSVIKLQTRTFPPSFYHCQSCVVVTSEMFVETPKPKQIVSVSSPVVVPLVLPVP